MKTSIKLFVFLSLLVLALSACRSGPPIVITQIVTAVPTGTDAAPPIPTSILPTPTPEEISRPLNANSQLRTVGETVELASDKRIVQIPNSFEFNWKSGEKPPFIQRVVDPGEAGDYLFRWEIHYLGGEWCYKQTGITFWTGERKLIRLVFDVEVTKLNGGQYNSFDLRTRGTVINESTGNVISLDSHDVDNAHGYNESLWVVQPKNKQATSMTYEVCLYSPFGVWAEGSRIFWDDVEIRDLPSNYGTPIEF